MTTKEMMCFPNRGAFPAMIVVFVTLMWIQPSESSQSLCLPGFECVHGICTSGTTCQCDEGWTGVLCTQPMVVPTTTNLSQTGSIDVNLGQPTPPGEVQSAVTEGDADEGGEGGPDGNKFCAPGFECVHGVCDSGIGLRCICEDGWQGPFCNQANSAVFQEINDTGNFDFVRPPLTTVDNDFEPEEGYGPLRDISLRYCYPGFVCRYGNCTRNPIACLCEGDWRGVFCHIPCPVNCGPHGRCTSYNASPDDVVKAEIDGKKYWCECDIKYTGSNCSVIREYPVYSEVRLNPYVVVGICTLVAVVMAITLTILPYVLWRRGNITMLKIVFWFQNIEDDDGRLYDAFVSYASTEEDRQFVMECLIPVLEEQMSYTLCIHERDFMPGNYITSNIMDSVRQSRRTLMVISPAFVSRNWCQFEFQMAVAEMIEKRHRILPVMMGDMEQIKQESNMNETFLRVLNTVTYLQYPKEDASEAELQRFWKRLELSMPKRTTQSIQSAPCSPAPTPTSITPLSVTNSSLQHPYKTNGIIFPLSPQKMNDSGEINIESSSTTNPTGSHQISFKRDKKTGFVAWFRRKFGRRKESTKRPSVYLQNVSSNAMSVYATSNGKSSESNGGLCVENDDKTISGKLTFQDSDEKEGKPPHIDLAGWTWPSAEAI